MIERYSNRQLALLQFNLLRSSGIFEEAVLKGSADSAGTLILDLKGKGNFYRVPLKGDDAKGYLDLAVDPIASNGLLLGIVCDHVWDEVVIIGKAKDKARTELPGVDIDKLGIRFVVYRYPRVGVQFIDLSGQSILLLDADTFVTVSPSQGTEVVEYLSRFERLPLEEVSARRRKFRADKYKRQVQVLGAVLESIDTKTRVVLTSGAIDSSLWGVERTTYGGATGDATIDWPFVVKCKRLKHYPLRGQLNEVWCVPASLEMILAFYCFDIDQESIAKMLCLEMGGSVYEFDLKRIADLPGALIVLSNYALTGSLRLAPSWEVFRNEIDAGRPIVDIIDGHARTIAGYVSLSMHGQDILNGLVVFDPSPSTEGTIICWESVDRYEHLGAILSWEESAPQYSCP